ncbi:hypothetical protein ABT297_04150 [Dactylosporangium sp. NPDC000555]|uniref:hypothetical protein n=1 Tax=Dactylosporangium sp. NPDC000555 TaxID=3154260 RepID=UPI003319207E
MPDQPTPDQLADFDQIHAALDASVDTLIGMYGAELADGQHPAITLAGLATWLVAHGQPEALAEQLAVAVRRLHEAEVTYERGKAGGIAEGRRQATEGARAGYDQAVTTLRDVADRTGSPAARWAADYLAADPDRRAPAVAVAGPWEPAEQPAGLVVVSEATTCTVCGDDIWATEQARPIAGGFRCLVCDVNRKSAEQPEPAPERCDPSTGRHTAQGVHPSMSADLHQRLLAYLDDLLYSVGPDGGTGDAVRAVVELHKPELFGGIVACLACSPGMPPPILMPAPCLTIQAIARELGIEQAGGDRG